MDQSSKKSPQSHDLREARYGEFVSLLARHDQAIRRFVRSLLPTRDGVDDVMQETALECWKKFSEFAPKKSEDVVDEFIRWACVIARYKALSWSRDRARDRLVFREDVIDKLATSATSRLAHRDDQHRAVMTCLGKLTEDQRRLVLSVHSPGQSVSKIAAETGEAARRLYSRVNVLRKRLLQCVQGQYASEVGHG